MRNHPQSAAWAALAAVCVFWGTTYLGIRIALESFPPLTLVALRYIASGSLILLGARIRGLRIPHGREFWLTARNGLLVLGIGNGCLAVAEQWIPSGLAALFITTGPFWMSGIEALIPGGERLRRGALAGMLVGLAGVAFLLSRGIAGTSWWAMVSGFGVLQFGCLGWSLGAILQRRIGGASHPIVSGGVQQLAAGVAASLAAAVFSRGPVHWTASGVGAIVYLVVFGSIVGYSAFIYAMSELPVSMVSVYNYVNPAVAVFLGWLFYREAFGLRELVAMAVIFTGVYLVKRSHA